jgi:lysophospholipase L1-like esterase
MLHLLARILIAAAFFAGAVTHAQIEVRVPAAGDAAEAATDGAAARPVWLRVADVTGSYTIPYIQSSARLQVRPTFASDQVVEAEVGLVAGDGGRREPQAVKTSGEVVEFTGLSSGEYSLEVTGRDATGKIVARDRHGPVAVGTVIAALGDSITEGYHSRGFHHDSLDLTPAMFPAEVVSRDKRNYPQFAPTTAHHRPDINCFTSWMPRLNDLLAEKWREPVFIANEGWGGITTGRYLQMMKTDASWQNRMRLLRPGVWLIHLGVNDGRANLGADEVTRNLAAIVDILVKEYAATPSRIFVASPSYDYAPGAADRLAEYRTAIGKLVAEKGLKSGPDFFTAYATDRPRYYGTDPVHPNAEGVELMARLWAEALPAVPPEYF